MITENEIIQAIRSMTDIRGQYSPAIQDIKYLTGQGYEVELE
jgi:hypothetical protein